MALLSEGSNGMRLKAAMFTRTAGELEINVAGATLLGLGALIPKFSGADTAISVCVGFAASTLWAMAIWAQRKKSSKKSQSASTDLEMECVNAIRMLAVDAINKSNSGHPGAPMGQAPIGYLLFAEMMKFNPENPAWINRDRFVLSSGHGCMLQYALLHLAGYKSVSMDDIKQFRKWGSKCPGHPENFETEGIEVTTGPLGMGISNAVGLAITEAHLAATYNKPGLPLIDNYTYAILGDGCMQEGITHEACALAGHLGLGKLIALYDDNNITIDGRTDLSFTEDVCKRFEAYGWHTVTVEDGNTDIAGLRRAIEVAKAQTDKPTLIKVKTLIGYGSPNKADTHAAHGLPLGADEAVEIRKELGWKFAEFEIPSSVYATFRAHAAKGAAAEQEWSALWSEYQHKEPALAAQFERAVLERKLPDGWADALPTYSSSEKGKATRINSQDCINGLASVLPEFMGGSADLASSTMTLMKATGDFSRSQYAAKNMRFGVREFGMAAIANAMSLSKTGMVPYCSTFLVFTDYMRHAIRMAAMSQAGTIFVMTHDSVALGEDGPTHQPVETIPSLRLIPDLVVIRPADGNETAGAYKIAVERSKLESMPTMLCLSRQALPNLEKSSVGNVARGAYAVLECDDPEIILVATGSEVSLCMDAAKEMTGKRVRVVSMPCVEIFREQPSSYKEELLPKEVPKLSVECAVPTGWQEWADAHIGLNTFGASAPGGTCMDKFGFNIPNVMKCAERCLAGEMGVLSDRAPARQKGNSPAPSLRSQETPGLSQEVSESKVRKEKGGRAEENQENEPLIGA